jgi:purine-nucleoside phosphorylase
MAGRFHLYEGYGYDEVTFPILVMRRLGVRTLIVTNAAGGIRPHVRVGDLMLVRDHIGLLGGLPVPPARPETNRRPEYYSQALLQAARSIAAREEIALQEGTLAFMKGPSYETPAELEMLRRIGADAVTMSTVPEVLAAWRAGMRVLGMSIICNLAFGLPRHRVDHCSIIAAARRAQEDYTCLLERLVGSGSIG